VGLTAEEGIHFLALLLMAAALVVIGVLAGNCAWCAWRDRRQARHGH
jgi:hypothetical protein